MHTCVLTWVLQTMLILYTTYFFKFEGKCLFKYPECERCMRSLWKGVACGTSLNRFWCKFFLLFFMSWDIWLFTASFWVHCTHLMGINLLFTKVRKSVLTPCQNSVSYSWPLDVSSGKWHFRWTHQRGSLPFGAQCWSVTAYISSSSPYTWEMT